jgi:hypothetical protein
MRQVEAEGRGSTHQGHVGNFLRCCCQHRLQMPVQAAVAAAPPLIVILAHRAAQKQSGTRTPHLFELTALVACAGIFADGGQSFRTLQHCTMETEARE